MYSTRWIASPYSLLRLVSPGKLVPWHDNLFSVQLFLFLFAFRCDHFLKKYLGAGTKKWDQFGYQCIGRFFDFSSFFT